MSSSSFDSNGNSSESEANLEVRRTRKKKTRFGEVSDESEYERKETRRDKKKTPLEFVKSNARDSDVEMEDAEDLVDTEPEAEKRPSFSTQPKGTKSRCSLMVAAVNIPVRETSFARQAVPPKPVEKASKDFAKFTKNSTGIGMKLMMKMGYSHGQGLGSDKKGIVNPVDVKLRPKQMGLGHKGFDERTDAVIAKDGPLNLKKETKKKTTKKAENKDELASKWDKIDGGYRRKKQVVRSYSELIAERESFGITSQKESIVIDMTGIVRNV